MATDLFLIVAETFYSIQGEGPWLGRPAVFLRLAGCNLQCNGFSYRDPVTQEHLGCDSKAVWRRGNKFTPDALLAHWQAAGWHQALEQGAHLIITGGEPMLQQSALLTLLKQLPAAWFIEVETNGTLAVDAALLARINHFNVSPKLANSGESRAQAYVPAVLQTYAASERAIFKFVVQQPADIAEIVSDYQQAFTLPASRIWLMPEAGTRDSLAAKQAWLIELCKSHAFNFSTRLHLTVWGEVTGV